MMANLIVAVVTVGWFSFISAIAGPWAAVLSGITGGGVAMAFLWEAGKKAVKD